MIATGKLDLLVIQPTPFCNLACDYCYLGNKDDTSRMSPEVLRRTFERVLESPYVGDSFTVVWHAGEPTVVPIDWYERAFAAAEAANGGRVAIQHSFQTNATLLDDRWCDFIKRSGIRIGVSLDGPAFLHDRHRVRRNGAGSFAAAMRGVAALRRAGIDFHVICVLTRESLAHAEAIYRFCIENDIRRIGFNVEESEGDNAVTSLAEGDARAGVEAFLGRFFDLVQRGDRPLVVREFDNLAGFLLHGQGDVRPSHECTPFSLINVAHNGDFSTFSPELLGTKSGKYADFVLGNVMTTSFADAAGSRTLARQHADIQAGIERCRAECPYFMACGGGTPSNKYFENGTFDSSTTRHCGFTKKAVIDVVLSRLESHA